MRLVGEDFFSDIVLVGFPQPSRVDDVVLESLMGLSRLPTLSISGAHVTDRGLEHLREMTQLEILDISNTHITGRGLGHLKGMTKLATLDVSDTQIMDEGIEHLGGITQLETLDLSNTQITDEGLEHLGRMAKLESLDLSNTQITDRGLQHLRGLMTLRSLALSNTQIANAGLTDLQELRTLRYLELSGTQVTGDRISLFERSMRHCRVSYMEVEPPWLTTLGDCVSSYGPFSMEPSGLKSLTLRGPNVTDDTLKYLHQMTRLEYLDLLGTQVTAQGIKELQEALPECEIHWTPPPTPNPNLDQP